MSNTIIIQRLTALWALSEAALGGLLHAMKIPLTGLFVGGSAVVLITLIAMFSDKRGAILKATVIVMAIKGMVSPHTPLMAYVAVGIQGVLGEFFFGLFRNTRLSALLLGTSALLLSGLQKIIILTVLFGTDIWTALDEFAAFVLRQFSISAFSAENVAFSATLIGSYLLAHLLMGLFVGIQGPRLGRAIKRDMPHATIIKAQPAEKAAIAGAKKHRKARPVVMALFAVLIILLVLSYTTGAFEEGFGAKIALMLLRAIIVTILWYFLLAPLLLHLLQRFLAKKRSHYAAEIRSIVELLPALRGIVSHSWRESGGQRSLKRIQRLIYLVVLYSLTFE